MDKNKVFAVMFIFITFLISIGSAISNASYFNSDSKLYNENNSHDINRFISWHEKLDFIFGENNIFSKQFIEIWSFLNRSNTSNISLIEDVQYGNLIQDENKSLYFPEPKKDIKPYAQKAVSLADKTTNFIYIQAPNKVIPGFTNSLVLNYNHANENADEFLKTLNQNNIKTFDLREKLFEQENKDSLFYKSDHHWTTETAFWAFGEIIQKLDESFDLSLDTNNYYRDINNYKITKYNDCYLGSLGRRTGASVSGLDDYTFIEPNFDTDYRLYNMLQSKDDVIKSRKLSRCNQNK